MTQYLTIEEAARWLGVAPVTVWRRIQKGQLPARRVGRIYVLDAARLRSVPRGTLRPGRPRRPDRPDRPDRKHRRRSRPHQQTGNGGDQL